MSISVSSDLNLLNLPQSLDLGINVYSSTIVGYFAGKAVNKSKNVIVGYKAFESSKNSARNVTIGFDVGNKLIDDDNYKIIHRNFIIS